MNNFIKIVTLIVAAFFFVGCASDTIMTANKRTPVSAGQVSIYQTAPPDYKVIGIISVDGNDLDKAVAELKRKAAEIGANGIILNLQNFHGQTSYKFGLACQAICTTNAN